MRRNIPLKPYGGGCVPEYCSDCGAPLERKHVFQNRYNRCTGEAIWWSILQCSSFWGRFFHHPKYEFDENGDEHISYDYM